MFIKLSVPKFAASWIFLGDLTEFNLTITFMDKKTMKWSLYEAPSVKTLDILSEGVLCMSGELDAQDWKTGNSNWFEEV